MNRLILILTLSSMHIMTSAQLMTATQLIEKSCHYHDPDQIMTRKGVELHLEEPRSGQNPRMTTLSFNPRKNVYIIRQDIDGQLISYDFIKEQLSIKLNGNTDFSESEKKKYKLTEERALLLKNYYYYLWSLPCNLLGSNAKVDDKVSTKVFGGRELLECTISYPSESDGDTWRFYFDTESYALSGYMFFSRDSDGEYILLEDEKKYKSLKIPAQRSWYDNHDDQFLATDRLTSIEKYKKP